MLGGEAQARQHQGRRGREPPGWPLRLRRGGLQCRWAGAGEAGVAGGQAPPGSAGQGGFSCTAPGSSLLSSTSPLFVPLPLGCQIWLTQSVVSLLRLAPGPKLSALHHCSSPCTGRGEGGPEGQGQAANPQLASLTSCSLSCLSPRGRGLRGAAEGSPEAGPGL